MTVILDWLKGLVAFFLAALKALCDVLKFFLNLLRGRLVATQRREDCCIQLPPEMRPRPDPYIYSQEWLSLRKLAFTWDNPDFRLFDASGAVVDRMSLQPGKPYRVRVRIHNGSTFASIGTTVALEVLEFGVGGVVTAPLGVQAVDVPPLGSSEVQFHWTTPATGGHNCLRARIHHPDDGNPLNNVGQHNTQVAQPASPTRALTFQLRNRAPGKRSLRLEFDSYRLPQTPLCPGSLEERNGPAHLRRLRELNDRSKSPVPESLKTRIAVGGAAQQAIGAQPGVEVAAGEAVAIRMEAEPPPRGQPGAVINIHAFDDQVLVGGLTMYVDAEV